MMIWLGLAAALLAFLIWQNNDIVVTRLDYADRKVPPGFDGYRVLHVSDLHSKRFGRRQKRLLRLAGACRPDIIVISGDVIDGRRKWTRAALSFVSQAAGIAPVFFAAGNHEWRYSRYDARRYDALKEELLTAGATVLDTEKTTLVKGNDRVSLMGVKDIAFNEGDEEAFEERLATLADGMSGMTLLLSHHPEKFELYARYGFGLVFSGHAHGGQIRLPGIGGLFAPGQGLLPKYTSGLHRMGETSMVVSRGLGNSLFPFRVFNRPELVLVTLKRI